MDSQGWYAELSVNHLVTRRPPRSEIRNVGVKQNFGLSVTCRMKKWVNVTCPNNAFTCSFYISDIKIYRFHGPMQVAVLANLAPIAFLRLPMVYDMPLYIARIVSPVRELLLEMTVAQIFSTCPWGAQFWKMLRHFLSRENLTYFTKFPI